MATIGEATMLATDGRSELREAIVHGSSKGFVQSVRVAGHTFTADEPITAGGSEAGPNPYDLLISALGTCTSMTISMYARRKGWPLDAVTVRLHHAKVYASDCADCETKDGMIDRIHRAIELHAI